VIAENMASAEASVPDTYTGLTNAITKLRTQYLIKHPDDLYAFKDGDL